MILPQSSRPASGAGTEPVPADPVNGIAVPDGDRLLEWLAVLSVEGVAYHLTQQGGAWTIHVEPDALACAREALLAHARLHRDWPPQPVSALAPVPHPGVALWPAFWGCHILGLFYLWLGPYHAANGLHRAAGAWRAALRAGDAWRAVTALMMHADIGHLASNLLFLFWFAVLVGRRFGAGLGWLLIVTAGATGNALVAWAGPGDSVGIGASTACFGALGLLVADGVAAHVRRIAPWRDVWRRAWLPLGAGLALLGMTGAAPGTDVLAHLFGFLAGMGWGSLAAGVIERPPAARWQWTMAAMTVALVAASWILAWRAAGQAG